MANGIGDETVWLCPTLDQTNPYDDLSSEGNNGTQVGSVTVVSSTGSGGSHAFEFPNNGSYNEYVSFSDIGITSADSYTVSMWINAQDTGGIQIMLYAGQSNGSRFCNLQGTVWDYFQCGPSANMLETGMMDEGSWQHVLFTYDRSNNGRLELWVDGYQEYDTNDAGTNTIGNQWLFLGRYGYEGMIDDFRCFDRVLSSTEIGLLASERGYESPETSVYNPFSNISFSSGQRVIR